MISERPVTRLNPNGKLVLTCAVLFIVFGLVIQHWVALLWGQTLVVFLSLAYLLTHRKTLELRGDALRLAARPNRSRAGGLVAGQEAELTLRIDSRSARHLRQVTLTPKLSSTVGGPTLPLVLDLPSMTRSEQNFSVKPSLAGIWHLFGMRLKILDVLNLFQVETYLPCPLELRVFPQTRPLLRLRSVFSNMKNLEEKKGSHVLPVVGLGSDLKELREHAPGIPFKQIDWKATARMRKLIAKEYESELTLSLYLALDISSTMRWGPVGQRKLDYAQTFSLSMARAIISSQDLVGLSTFDAKLYSFFKAQSGPRHLVRLVDALIELNNIVHRDFTEGSQDELVARIGDYLFWQENIDLRRSPGHIDGLHPFEGAPLGEQYFEEAIHHYVREFLDREKRLRSKVLYGKRKLAEDPREADLRLFCLIKGIELPYLIDGSPEGKSVGLADVLEKIVLTSRSPQFILVISDCLNLEFDQRVIRTAQLLRKRHHRLAILSPFGPDFEQPRSKGDPTTDKLYELFLHEEKLRLTQLRFELRRAGIPLLSCSPQQAMTTVLRQLSRFKRAI